MAALSGGAVPNARIQGGVTALVVAAFEGNADIAKLLLDKGAQVNAKTDNGLTAIMVAADGGHFDVVKLLLNRGADANVHLKEGVTAFHMAAIKGHTQVADLLRPRTKGAASVRVKTVVAPLTGDQKCLSVTKSPDAVSERVACLKEGVEVSTAGTSGDEKWAILQKPVSGWVPEDKLQRALVSQAPVKHTSPRESDEFVASPSKEEGGTKSSDMPSFPSSGGGEWWRR
jgi:hypothetical protein